MKKTIEQIMNEGWEELIEIGFGRECVLYKKIDSRMLYNTETNEVILEYKKGLLVDLK